LARVIGVFSGKGGVGKTTLVANLSASLSKNFNKKIVAIDSNISISHLGMHLGLYEDPKVTLREVLLKKASPMSALYIHPSTGVRLLPSPLNSSFDGISLRGIENVVDQLSRDNDIVIIDAAPGLGREVIAAAECIDDAIIVATPDIPSVTDALKTINLIKRINDDINILGLVVNRVRNERYELTKNEIESACNINVITHIPEDVKIPESIAKGSPVVDIHPYSKASIAFNRLSAALIGQNYEPNNLLYKLMKMAGFAKEDFVKIPFMNDVIRSEQKKKKKPKVVKIKDEVEREEAGEEKSEDEEENEEEEVEARDVKKLRREVDESIKSKPYAKSDIRKRLAMKIKERLGERGIEE